MAEEKEKTTFALTAVLRRMSVNGNPEGPSFEQGVKTTAHDLAEARHNARVYAEKNGFIVLSWKAKIRRPIL